MDVLDIKDGKLIIKPEALALEFFDRIWSKDKSKDKLKAYNNISYVYFYCNPRSPYFSYPEDKKIDAIKEYVIRDKNFKTDSDIEYAISIYSELVITPSMKVVKAAEGAIYKMETYFNTVNFEEDDIDRVSRAIINMPKMIAALKEAKAIAESEDSSTTKVRGNQSISLLEQGDI